MDGKLLVFLRAYNDIDHIVPVIYKWLSLEDVPTDIVITTNPDYLDDSRIQFLRQFENLQVHFIDEFLTEEERKRKSLKSQIGKHPAPDLFSQASGGVPFVERMLDTVFGSANKGVVIFDWTYTDFVRLVIKAAKERNFITISLPHGDRPHYNRMETLNDLNYSRMSSYKSCTIFDYTVVPNDLCAERYKSYIEPDRIKVLGSPRYNDEWIKIISTIFPPYCDVVKDCDKLKIVFFLRNFNYPVFWEEVIRTIKLVLQFPDVYLIVKHHTRSATIQRLIQSYPEMGVIDVPNLKFAYDDIHTESLLQWADVVLDLGTSVSFEAVKRKKPVLAMEYLHANRSTIAQYMKSCDIQCRDDLYNWMERFFQNKSLDFYDEAERQQFIREIIDVPDQDVLTRYVKFLKSCF
jgi:hypothetical protein